MSNTIPPSKIFNQPYETNNQLLYYGYDFLRRLLGSSSPCIQGESLAPPVNAKMVKLQECPEEFDETKREAKFALRSTDVGSWNSSSSRGGSNTDSNHKKIQHWSVVVHFPKGDQTYLFQAWEENGLLQAGRAKCVDYEVFEKATKFGTTETSPNELLTKAQQVKQGNYALFGNNCQTWTRTFLYDISKDLLKSLYKKIPATDTSSGPHASKYLNKSPPTKQ